MVAITPVITDLKVGDRFALRELLVTPQLNEQYMFAAEDYSDMYLAKDTDNPGLAHPALLLSFFSHASGARAVEGADQPESFDVPENVLALHSRDVAEFINPAYVGRLLRSYQTIVEIYERRGKLYHVYAATIVDDHDREILRRRASRAILVKGETRSTKGQGSSLGSDDPIDASDIQGKPKPIVRERLLAFSGGPLATPGWPHRNTHTDHTVSRAHGLEALAVQGTLFEAHVVELLAGAFGSNWYGGGKIDIRFMKPVREGDVLTAGAKVLSATDTAKGRQVSLSVWTADQTGVRVLDGTAEYVGP